MYKLKLPIHKSLFITPQAACVFCNACTWFSFQTMVTNVSSLLKTVKSVEDKALRGTRALESTTDAVKQAVLVSCPLHDMHTEIYQLERLKVKWRVSLFSRIIRPIRSYVSCFSTCAF